MSAAELAHALGGRKGGSGWTARCPAHDDRTPSLSIGESADGKILVKCFAGCEQAQVIDALRDRGLWTTNGRHNGKILRQQPRQSAPAQRDREEPERTAVALRIWRFATPASGTLVETYLQSRGIDIALPSALRFYSGLPHPSGGYWPAMVARVTRGTDNEPLAIHRTYISLDGAGKAPVNPQKAMKGPCRGGAVRLGIIQPDQWLVIGEGIETTLSVMQACALPGWAALSANGIRNLILPPEAAMVLICADNDASGIGQRAARDAAGRFLREGRRVQITTPLTPGTDFNDLLNLTTPTHVEAESRHVA